MIGNRPQSRAENATIALIAVITYARTPAFELKIPSPPSSTLPHREHTSDYPGLASTTPQVHTSEQLTTSAALALSDRFPLSGTSPQLRPACSLRSSVSSPHGLARWSRYGKDGRLTCITKETESVHFLDQDFGNHDPYQRRERIDSVNRLYPLALML